VRVYITSTHSLSRVEEGEFDCLGGATLVDRRSTAAGAPDLIGLITTILLQPVARRQVSR
jgi:hypothetical protein